MTIRITCRECGQQSVAAEKLRGKTLGCPRCGTLLEVPALSTDDHMPVREPNKPPANASHASHGPDPFSPPRKKSDHHDLIDMTAMVDIVFFLLIYFLVTSFVSLAAAIHAPSTESTVGKIARSSADSPEGSALTVRIDADDVVWIEQEAVFGPPEIYARLKSTREEVGAERLRIAASSEATHGKMVMVLDAGVSAGFKSAQLAIEEVQ